MSAPAARPAAHICALAREIGVDTIILPKLASGLCAFGEIISDVKYNYMATSPARLDNAEAYRRLNTLFEETEAKGVKHLSTTDSRESNIDVKRSLEMRYVGQVHECTVDIDMFEINEKTIERVKQAFHRRHEELYTYSEPHSLVEVVNIESTLYGRIDKPKLPALKKGVRAGARDQAPPQVDLRRRRQGLRVAVYDGAQLGAGAILLGPPSSRK